jgi:hypothetical protein
VAVNVGKAYKLDKCFIVGDLHTCKGLQNGRVQSSLSSFELISLRVCSASDGCCIPLNNACCM